MGVELSDYTWDALPMKIVERAFDEYMSNLYQGILDGDPEGGVEVLDTLSGEPFCGCETCEQREVFAFLMPRFIDMYEQGSIRRKYKNNLRPV
jgi:hypothetical protein